MKLKALTADIKRQMDYYDISAAEAAAGAQMSRTTLFKRLRSPETMTLGELERLCKKLHIELKSELL